MGNSLMHFGYLYILTFLYTKNLISMQSHNSANYKFIRMLRAIFGLLGRFKTGQIKQYPKWGMACGFLMVTSVYAQTGNYSYGFETAPGPNDWSANIQTASGAITAASGSFYGQEPNAAGNFTRFGGYNSIFPCNGYKTSMKIYLDVAGGYANDTRADYSSAANGSDGNHERDFIFSIGFYDDAVAPGSGNRFVVSASNNSLGNPKGGLNPTVIATASGWYRFEHSFENNAGVLQVVMKVYDPSNSVVGTWTLSNPADLIPSVVGGNRYGWVVANQFPSLAIDDIELTLNPGNLPTASTDFETFSTGTVNYQGPGCVATIPAGGGGTYTVPSPYGSLWTVTDEWGTAPSSFDQEVTDDGSANMVWRVSNAVTTGGFSNLPNSPSSAMVAGESTAALYNDRGNDHTAPLNPPNSRASATTSNFHSGFRFKSSTGAAQSNLSINVSPTPRQSSIRSSFVSITDNGSTGFDLTFFETSPGNSFDPTVIATNLSYTDWHQLDIYINFVDGLGAGGIGNDIVVVELDGVVVHVGTSWESFYAENPGSFPNAPYAVDALMFRLSGTAAPANSGNGFYIDDVTYDNIALPAGPIKLYTDNSLTTLISTHFTIQAAVDAASAGNAIDVPAGTYMEDLLVNKANLTLIGAGIDQSIIDHSGQPGHGNAGVYILANGVTMKGFTVIDNDGGSVPRYGLKVGTSSVTTDDVTLDSVKVTQSFRTGFDLARPKNIVLQDVFAINNGGAGIFMSNPEGALLNDITTSGNPWTGVSISSRSDWPGDATGVVFTGTNSFGENGGKNGGVQIESDNTLPISWGSDIADGKDVTIQLNELGYTLSGPTTNTFGSIIYAPYFRFFQTLPQAQSAAGIGPDHVDRPRYIQDAFCSSTPDSTNFYVYDFADTAMTIQAAVDAAVDGNTVNVFAGEFTEQVEITKDLTLIGQGKGVTTVKGLANMPLFFTTSGPNYPVIYVHDADSVIVQNLTVDGAGQGNTNNRYQGVGYSNAGGKITNVEVKAVRHTPLNGVQGGIGIFVDASSGTARSVLVTNCMVYDFQKNGMSFSGEDLIATVDSNMITGAGPLGSGLPAQNGIQFYGTNGGNISNNQISGINYTPSSFVACGIISFYDLSTINIFGNRLDSNEVGIYNQGNSLAIYNNEINGGDFGLYSYAGNAESNTVTANNNSFTKYDYGALIGNAGSGTVTSTIQNNSFTDIEGFTIYAFGTVDTVQGQCNWHGSVNPNDVENLVVGQVAYEPYLIDGTDSLADVGFQPNPGACQSADCPDGSCDGCFAFEAFNETSATAGWITDRYEPDSFYVDVNDSLLVHLIDASDAQSGFQATQGKKSTIDYTGARLLTVDLYVPSSWETTGRRMAGLWGVANDDTNNISGYPIIEFTSEGTPRFRAYEGDGSWIDMGLPCDFAYDEWYTLRIELLPSGEFLYSVEDLSATTMEHGQNASSSIREVILQGHNTAAGVTYEINWDNLAFGNAPEVLFDTILPEPIAVGSGISNEHMAVGEYCGIDAGLKAIQRFLGDIEPVDGNVYQVGTGVSPTNASNTTPDPGTARWNYVVSVNLGDYTFNDLNVYLDIDFDNSDSACGVGPYVADISQFMITNSMGGTSVYQDAQNLGFNFWQTIGDPAILPFDPYAEGTYDLRIRIENKDGLELLNIPISVEVDCEFLDPEDNLEPPMLACPSDTSINAGTVIDPWITGMATASGSCEQTITYTDSVAGDSCGTSGVVIRTWAMTYGDSTYTCDQTITIIDTTAPTLSACPADITAFAACGDCETPVTFEAPMAMDETYFEGFENAAFVSGQGSYQGWNDASASLTRVVSGTNGISSFDGTSHGLLDTNGAGASTGAYTRLGGYSSEFGDGFSTYQSIYIDLSDPAVSGDTYGWDLSTAASNQSGGHLRDFIFHTASNASGNVLIAGSNNTNFTRRNDLAGLNNYEITTSGWYTFEWVFRDSAGALAVDLNLLDAGGNHLWTETRYNAGDDIASTAGGNRYMWFTFLEVENLHIDNTSMIRDVMVSCSIASGDTLGVGTTAVSCSASDACGNVASCSFDVNVEKYYLEEFNDSVITSDTAAPGVWYTDRYAPDSFYVNVDSVLVHSIDAADGATSRPSGFSSAFYNTQGRKYDLNCGQLIQVDLYVPAAWENTGRRMAGVWGTAVDMSSSISGYPIIEFTSDSIPRFRGYEGDGSWIDMGLPCDFAYDEWYTLRMEMLPNGEFRYSVNDLRITTELHGVNGSVNFTNLILQGHNTDAGVTYEINWDNLIYGDAPDIMYDATLPDAIAIGSGLSSDHMAIAEYCEISAGIKAHKRFLGDVTPVDGDRPGDTYQFGTGVSPQSSDNMVLDSGLARWNYLLSVNLGSLTFNEVNVYLDIDFDPSDSACGVGPYTADLSAFLITNGQGATSMFQSSENLGFGFWQTIGDPAILPFDPYAEGVYDITLRVETPVGIELIDLPIRVDVSCDFVDPEDDLEPPMLACPSDTTISSDMPRDPWLTGMATASGSCEQTITYSDNVVVDSCGTSGVVIRTWSMTYGDSTYTCDQTITIIDTMGPVLTGCPMDTTLFATNDSGAVVMFDEPTAYDLSYFEGFENAAFMAGSSSLINYQGWNSYNGQLNRVASGTDGITSKSGSAHAVIDTNGSVGQTGVFGRLGGYSTEFGDGFTVSQDVYIDLTDPAVTGDTYGWDLSVAANSQSNSHRRDFIFHVASNASGNVLIGASNNTNGTRRNDLASLSNNYEITASGWYHFEWVFRDSAGSLAVDLNMSDDMGTELFSETRYNASDDIATIVGGNRYIWFIFLEVENLHIDNTQMVREAALSCTAESGDHFYTGITPVNCSAADACGNGNSCSFNVTVVDTAGALNFDGADDVVSVPHDAGLSAFGNAITVEAWIKPEAVSGNQGIIGKWNDLGPTNRRSYLMWLRDDEVQFYVSSTGADFPSALSSDQVSAGEWTHVAGTFDGSTINVYINGVLSTSTPFSGSLYNNTVDPLLIGAVDGGGSSRRHFDGSIDEVRIYNRALCADEILAHTNCELTGSETGLAAYYSFNQGFAFADNSGLDTAIDNSSNGHTGSLQNFALNGASSNWALPADSLNGSCAPYLAPSLVVYGNNQLITNGDNTADVSDSTDFGTVDVGESNENCFYLVNDGTDVLNISSVSANGGDSGEFTVSGYGSGVLNPGDSTQVCVTYSPSVAASHSTTIEVESDDCTANTFSFAISGNGFEQSCDTIRIITDSDWQMSTTVTQSSVSGNWNGVAGVLPDTSTFTMPVTFGQPYGYQTIFPVDSAQVIQTGNNIRYFHKSIFVDSLVDIGSILKATFDDQMELYVNGKLLAAHYQIGGSNSRLPHFQAEFTSGGGVNNGPGGQKPFGFVTADTLDNIFQPGINDLILVLRNLDKPAEKGGFSLSLQVDGCEGEIAPPDTIVVPVDTICDTVRVFANSDWMMSTTITNTGVSGNWSGVMGSLPDTSTFTDPVVLGQPYSYQTIFPVDSSDVIRAGNNIRYFHKRVSLDSLVGIGARVRSTFDDQIEVYINGNLLAGHYTLSGNNGKMPPFDAQFDSDGSLTNGAGGNKLFGFATSDTMDNIFKPGANDVIVVLRNLNKPAEMGGFSFSLEINGCQGEVELDTNAVPEDTLTTSIVSDNGWEKSTLVEASNFSGNWSGATSLPPSATYTLPAIEGQPYGYATIDPIDSAKVIKTENNITFFRRTFELTDNTGLDARFRSNVDDGMEIYINGKLVAREDNSGSANFRDPNHDLKFFGGTSPTNGFNGGDFYDFVTGGNLDTFFVTGTNEVVVAVRNKAKSSDMGGFSFRLDIDKGGNKVIVKSAESNTPNISERAVLDFEVYPNPTNGLVNVVMLGKLVSDDNEIIVQDVSGKIITRGSFESFAGDGGLQIDMSQYASGVYLIRVKSGDIYIAKRVMKD